MIKSLSGIRDVDLKILEELNDRDLLSFCLTNKYGKSLCNDEPFWRKRFVKRFGEHEKTPNRTWKDFYVQLVYYNDKYPYNLNRRMYKAAKSGMKNIDLIKYFISQGADHWNMALTYTARASGDKELMKFFISQGAWDLNTALINAVGGRKRDAINFLISQGANDWVWGYRFAKQIGDQELMDFFQAKIKE